MGIASVEFQLWDISLIFHFWTLSEGFTCLLPTSLKLRRLQLNDYSLDIFRSYIFKLLLTCEVKLINILGF